MTYSHLVSFVRRFAVLPLVLLATSLVLAACDDEIIQDAVNNAGGMADTGGDTGGVDTGSVGTDFLAQLNAYRLSRNLVAVVIDARLTRAAEGHTEDMRANRFLSHTGSNGSTLASRVRAQGFNYCTVAENVARGQTSVSAVMSAWQNSSGHNANLLNANVDSIGLGYSSDGNYWTLVLGRAC